jgi:hypothetical protein
MNIIDTKEKLIQYVKIQLGHPLINVEVTDEMIEQHIDYTIQKFTEFAYDGMSKVTFGFDTVPEVFDYILPDNIRDVFVVKGMTYLGVSTITLPSNEIVVYNNVYSVMTSPDTTGVASFVLNLSNQSLVETLFDKDVNFSFNPHSKLLRFHEEPQPRYVIYAQEEYIPKDIDRIYNQEWVKKMVTAKTKFSWGTVTGKFDQTLVSGARINYEAFKQEATEEILKLDEELLLRYVEPAPILVG